MPVKYKIKSADPVVVMAGRHKGQQSKVTKVDRKAGKLYVEGVNTVKRHMKPGMSDPEGGIIDKQMPIDISNVAYFCKKCDKGVRLGVRVLDKGDKARFCKSCGEIIDK